MNPASDFMQLHNIFVYLDSVYERYGELDDENLQSKIADALLAVSLLQNKMLKLERSGLVDK